MEPKFRICIFMSALICMFTILVLGCTKEDGALRTQNPFEVIPITSLTDKIPYQTLGTGKIVFSRINDLEGGSGIYVIDIDKKKSSGFRLNSGILNPCISPDGSKIACSLLYSGNWKSNWNIYIMNIDGSHCFCPFQSIEWESFPTWTPDGSKVLFCLETIPYGSLTMLSPILNATDKVTLMAFYYSEDPTLYIDSYSGGFSIAPDQKIVCTGYSMDDKSGILVVVPFKGRSGIKLIMPKTSLRECESPAFSPDGSKIAFLSIETDTLRNWKAVNVNIMNPDGTNITQLISIESIKRPTNYFMHRYASLCWAPDGSRILFNVAKDEFGGHLFVINSDGSGLTQITDNINAYDNEVSWSR